MQRNDDDRELLRQSGFFDAEWYRRRYPDVDMLGMDPVDHYLLVGASIDRNPSPYFDTAYYRSLSDEIDRSGINPLVHYLRHGAPQGLCPKRRRPPQELYGGRVDIVIPVYNALEEVQQCLQSIDTRTDGFDVHVHVVNDASDEETTHWLREFCGSRGERFELIEHEENRGYTRAVNTGLRAVVSPYIVVLNSDTVVTRNWLKRLIRCLDSDASIGIVGPLSNAASWQNVPDLKGADGKFAVNALPDWAGPEEMAAVVASASAQEYPRVPFVNGFCYLLSREVLETVGLLDEKSFPKGYGEENDLCVRAAEAGFELAICDEAYVYHGKSKSFGHAQRNDLSRQGTERLKEKHGSERFQKLADSIRYMEALERIRDRVRRALHTESLRNGMPEPLGLRILFVLPVSGGGGGVHSIVQEALGMQRLGVHVRIAVPGKHMDRFRRAYRELDDPDALFVPFEEKTLSRVASDFNVAVATIHTSVPFIETMKAENPGLRVAYYIQDYEPFFFERGSVEWQQARASYNAIDEAILFAKTHWLARTIEQEHGVPVSKVEPSIDHELYRPRPELRDNRNFVLSAMIRPKTPRRGAERTMRVLAAIAGRSEAPVSIEIFGCEEDDPQFEPLERSFPYRNHGRLSRPEVAEVLQRTDCFVDLSDYQAFGRTALEAMACGATAVVPIYGGTEEYAVDGHNGLVVDPFDEEGCVKRITGVLEDLLALRILQNNALRTAADFSIHKAAISELTLLAARFPELEQPAPKACVARQVSHRATA